MKEILNGNYWLIKILSIVNGVLVLLNFYDWFFNYDKRGFLDFGAYVGISSFFILFSLLIGLPPFLVALWRWIREDEQPFHSFLYSSLLIISIILLLTSIFIFGGSGWHW
ncbi:MAG: hypothetical protein EXS68_00555 [Candidatus Ryanbacteria bacterium]|nr:hypothetical protein [Candidatus Ryanbacteria bacterium]